MHKDIAGGRELAELKPARKVLEPEELTKKYCRMINAEESEICRKAKSAVDWAILMEMLYRCYHLKQPEIGRLVGSIDYSSISIARKRLRGLMKKDISLKQRVDQLAVCFSRLMGDPLCTLYPDLYR